jgi:hypothetical protein
MDAHPFYAYSAWLVFAVISTALLAAVLAGYWLGHVASRRIVDRSEIWTIQASILGLLALLLGFTFSVASSRYDLRRILVVDEANALGTTFLRVQALPEPYRTSLSAMLRRYIDLRLKLAPVRDDPTMSAQVRRETERLQQAMWKQAAALAEKEPTPVTAIFLTSLNESIDLYASRKAAYLARVPSTIMWILTCIAIVSLAIVGYGFGLSGERGWVVMALVAVVVAAVIVMIIDLDQPQSGPTRVSQQSMEDLRSSLSGFEEAGR